MTKFIKYLLITCYTMIDLAPPGLNLPQPQTCNIQNDVWYVGMHVEKEIRNKCS